MKLGWVVRFLSVALGAFVLYTSAFGAFEGMIHRAAFLGLVMALGFCVYPLGAGKPWRPAGAILDLIGAVWASGCCAYVILNYDRIMNMALPEAAPHEVVMTAGFVLIILELGRRALGFVFPVIVACSIAYALFGDIVPGRLGHRGFDVQYVTETLFLGELGIFGFLTGIGSTTVAAFILFGGLLLYTGAGQTFIDFATRATGGLVGGAAKIATVASGLFGMISGSAVANVATTGSFTIPLMKRLKYPPAVAGAVEAVASTGGQIAPPIMGAAAFLMAEITGIDYVTIAIAAAVPAFFYYLGVYLTIHMMAERMNLRGVPRDELPSWQSILGVKQVAPVVAAMGGLMFGILNGNSLELSVVYGVVGMVLSYVAVRLRQAKDIGEIATSIAKGLEDTGMGLVSIGVLIAGAQILVSMINLTGIGVTMSAMIAGLAGDNALVLGVLVAAVCLILGMGVPTTAAYVIVAAVMAPALTKMGVDVLAAHMFVFYFATISAITPPVCVAVFVAAGIAQTSWIQVARYAVVLAAVTYVIPFLFFYYPGILLRGGIFEILDGVVSGLIFTIAASCLFGGVRVVGLRLVDAAIFGVLALMPLYTHWAGWVAAGLGLALIFFVRRRAAAG